MKIAILTHPLGTNYGGILQAFALQKTLTSLGHDAWILNRQMDIPLKKRIKRIIKFVYKAIFSTELLTDTSNIKHFTEQIKPQTLPIRNKHQIRKVANEAQFDAYIVGSDQVWRPRYIRPITNFFFDFVVSDSAKRISYAASFGVDYWEFTDSDTVKCKQLLSKFSAISVRESSAIKLCSQHFQRQAIQVLDPTFLLKTSIYEKIIGEPKDTRMANDLFSFVFSSSTSTRKVIDSLKELYSLQESSLHPIVNGKRSVLPSVEQWLQHIRSSRIVVTDSFHVCVFSIIFKTPFYVVGNEVRGCARIESLLNLFELTDRFISGTTIPKEERLIDWDKTYRILERERKKSMDFLINALD